MPAGLGWPRNRGGPASADGEARTVGFVGDHIAPVSYSHLADAMPSIAAVARLLVSPFQIFVTHWNTIQAFVRRDIRGRYVTSVMGLSWAIIQPLALLVLYTFVFSYVLKIRPGREGHGGAGPKANPR